MSLSIIYISPTLYIVIIGHTSYTDQKQVKKIIINIHYASNQSFGYCWLIVLVLITDKMFTEFVIKF